MKQTLFLFVSLFALAGTIVAHSALERTDPKDGAVLKTSPAEIKMWFSEPIKVGLSTFEVRDAGGKEVDKKDLKADAKTPALVHLSLLGNLPPGEYTVSWHAVAQDLHVGKGSFHFRVQP